MLGADSVERIAERLGVSHGEAASQLSQLLPQVVDRATPDGTLPAGGGLGDIGALLGQLAPR